MDYWDFVKKLKKLNPLLRVRKGAWRAAGVFLYSPRDPRSDERGFIHLLGFSAPPRFRKFDWKEPNGDYNRGWKHALLMLYSQGLVRHERVLREFGGSVFTGGIGDGKCPPNPVKRTPQEVWDKTHGRNHKNDRPTWALGAIG